MKFFIITTVLLFTSGLSETLGVRPNVCESDKTADIQQCFNNRFKENEKKLNSAYQKLMQILQKKKNIDLMNAIKASEQQWVKFRDANCKSYQIAYKGGSFAQLGYIECKTDLASQRIQSLDAFIKDFSG